MESQVFPADPLPPLPRQWWKAPLLYALAVLALAHAAMWLGWKSHTRNVAFPDSWQAHEYYSPGDIPYFRWDAIRYWQVASHGYTTRTTYGPGALNMAWFPAYPAMAAGLNRVTYIPITVWLVIISNAATVASCVFLFWFVRRLDPSHPAAAHLAVLGLLLQPVGVFLFAAYTESLFILTSLVFFYVLLVRRNIALAALCALFAGLLRPTGIMLAVVLFFFLAAEARAKRQPKAWAAAFLYTAVALAGFVTYGLYLWQQTGNPQMVLQTQKWVGVGFSGENLKAVAQVWRPVLRIWHDFAGPPEPDNLSPPSDRSHLISLENYCALTAPVMVLLFFSLRRPFPRPMLLLAALLWGLPFFTHATLLYHGYARYTLATIAPFWMLFGIVAGRWPGWTSVAYLTVSGILMLEYAARFAQGFWLG